MRSLNCFWMFLAVTSLCGMWHTQGMAANTVTDSEDKVLTIRGVVVTSDDPPIVLPGATVIVKGTTRGVSTDSSGFFSIEAERGEVLRFQFIGYEPK